MQLPTEIKPSRRTIILAIAVPAALMLVGAGCMSFGDSLGDAAIQPVAVPLSALDQTQEAVELRQAKVNEDDERDSADVSVALIWSDEAAGKATPVEGEIGCADRIAYLPMHREAMTDSVLSDALVTLFAIRNANQDGLYNALWQSELSVEKILSRDGVTTEVWLKGTIASGGACDDPRIKAQIESTIKRFRPKYQIFLNGSEAAYRCLGDQSGQCK